MPDFLAQLEQRLGYQFRNSDLAVQGLTHKSFSNEQAGFVPHNERLEFLGDAVLELAVSDWVYRRYPEIPEGGLTRIRAEVVSEKGLSAIACDLRLGEGLRLGKGEEKSGGRDKPSLLSDAFEALLGAIYQDGGFSAASRVVERIFAEPISGTAEQRYGSDYKTCLQERFQAKYGQTPEYHLIDTSGPDHERIFTVEVRYDGRLFGKGSGTSKKSAEQKAAAAALDHIHFKKDC